MAHGLIGPPSNRKDRRWWWLSIISAILSFALSFTAYCSSLEETGWRLIVEAFYSSAELLLLHVPHDVLPHSNESAMLLLYIARPLAVVFIGATGLAVIMEVFGKELRRSWAVRRGKHIVICGSSRMGQQIASEFYLAGQGVVVVDNFADSASLTSATQLGASLLSGNPADPAILRKARIHRAAYLFAATEDDSANVGVAMSAINVCREKSASRSTAPSIFLHLKDPQLRASLRLRRAFQTDERTPRVSNLNVFENSARLLLARHPLDYVHIAEDDERSVQIVVIGFGLMGEALLVRAAMVAHYANLKRVRAIVVDLHAKRKGRLFRSRYPQFGQVCDAQFLEMDAEEPSAQARIAVSCADPRIIPTIVIAFDHDARGLSLALSLTDRLGPTVPVRVRLNENSGLATLLQPGDPRRPLSSQITAFGSLSEACARTNWVGDELDVQAKALHDDYVRRRNASGPVAADDRSMRLWTELDDDLIDSNRQNADHIPVKLRAIGYHIALQGSPDPGTLVTEFSDAEVNLLGKMEHQRWMAERFLAGWVFGPRDHDKRSSPYLVEWDHVPTHIQKYDLDFARILPGVLEFAKREIRK
jgi:voltage-gated potassium channel Kch